MTLLKHTVIARRSQYQKRKRNEQPVNRRIILFVYQREIFLRVGPKRSFELKNNIVAGTSTETIEFKEVNYSRDKGTGIVKVQDSLYQPVVKSFDLPVRYSVHEVSLQLTLRKQLLPGDYHTIIQVPGDVPYPITIRSFAFKVDSTRRAGVVTNFQQGAQTRALQRLGVSCMVIDSTTDAARLSSLQVILVDRDAIYAIAGKSDYDTWVR